MPKYTIHYFNGRGRAEVSRLILAIAGTPYTDHRIEQTEWPAHKPTAPLGQLPYAEIDSVVLPQSLAIHRYFAREAGLAGKSNLEQAQADAIVDTISDQTNSYGVKVWYVQDPKAKEEAEAKFNAEDLPKHLGNVEKLVTHYGKNKHSVGDSLTWADLYIFNTYLETFEKHPSFVTQFPHVNNVLNNVAAHPKVAAYLKTRQVTPW